LPFAFGGKIVDAVLVTVVTHNFVPNLIIAYVITSIHQREWERWLLLRCVNVCGHDALNSTDPIRLARTSSAPTPPVHSTGASSPFPTAFGAAVFFGGVGEAFAMVDVVGRGGESESIIFFSSSFKKVRPT
jgi:hypothetical protein